jgi:flagellar basal-body rod protein FlgC
MSGIGNLFSGMRTSASGLTAERTRIDVIAENIANARTTRTPEGGPYRRKVVMFEPLLEESLGGEKTSFGVGATQVVPDMNSAFERVLDPSHADAGPDGFVEYPNVNTVLEMADLITAMRAYEANLTAQENFVRMAERALELAR